MREVEPFTGMVAAPNILLIVGWPTTVVEALDVFPGPPSVEVTWTVLFFNPVVAAETFKETLHVPLAPIVPLDKLAEDVPATAVAAPPQVLFRLLGVATTNPAGRLSINATPVSAVAAFGFVMVKASEVTPFRGTVMAPNALLINGGVTTIKVKICMFEPTLLSAVNVRL